MPAPVSAFATSFLSRLLGRKTRTGRPDFSAGGGGAVAVEEAVCRAVGRGFFFISAEDSESDLEGTIILAARRATFADAGRPRS
jgi:hypothetical protein